MLEKILKSIKEGLTGDKKHDLNYLKEMAEKYENHVYHKEILDALGQMFYEILSKEEFKPNLEDHLYGVEEALSKSDELLLDEKYNEALFCVEAVVEAFEKYNDLDQDESSVTLCFREPIEEMLYTAIYEEAREVKQAEEDYSMLYYRYGDILLELENVEEAQMAFKKALEFNPMNFEIRSEYIRCFNILQNYPAFLEETKKAFRFAYEKDQIAHLYINLLFAYFASGDYDACIACLFYSSLFNDGKILEEELEMLEETTHKKLVCPTNEELKEIFEKYEIPHAPDKIILQILYSYIQYFKEDSADMAYYLCEYLYDLCEDKSILELMNEIQNADKVDLESLDATMLEDGSILKNSMHRYMRVQSEENFYDLLYVLSLSTVIVPTMSEDLGYEDGLKADILKSNDGRLFFPVFTNEKEIPQEYGNFYSRVHVKFVDCIEAAKRSEGVCGIVLNPFTKAMELNFEHLNMLLKMLQHKMN